MVSKLLPIVSLLLLLAACDNGRAGERAIISDNTPSPASATRPTGVPVTTLPDLGPAPEFSNQVWLNTDRPLTLADLHGKVVLIEFWTFG